MIKISSEKGAGYKRKLSECCPSDGGRAAGSLRRRESASWWLKLVRHSHSDSVKHLLLKSVIPSHHVIDLKEHFETVIMPLCCRPTLSGCNFMFQKVHSRKNKRICKAN